MGQIDSINAAGMDEQPGSLASKEAIGNIVWGCAGKTGCIVSMLPVRVACRAVFHNNGEARPVARLVCRPRGLPGKGAKLYNRQRTANPQTCWLVS